MGGGKNKRKVGEEGESSWAGKGGVLGTPFTQPPTSLDDWEADLAAINGCFLGWLRSAQMNLWIQP